MENIKERIQKITDYSKIKYIYFHDIFKEKKSPGELAQRDVIPEYPLILLHGYWNRPTAWKKFVPFFEANGYVKGKNIFLFDARGDNKPAIIDIRINAKKLQNLVQHILTLTGSSKLNLLAHSMGGLISRWYIEQLGGNANVHKLIMMGTPNHGSRYLPLFTRIVNFIDNKLETVQKNKENFEKHIKQIATENDIDHLGMAAIQMYTGSDFLTILGYKGLTNYYLITGIKGLPESIGGLFPKGLNDGAVHADSVDLTDVPNSHKVTFKLMHSQLRTKIVVFNQIMSFLVL